MRRGLAVLVVCLFLLGPIASAAGKPRWKGRIDRLARNRSISISVRDEGKPLYRWNARKRRTPASVQKLLASMALMDKFGPNRRFTTTAAAESVAGGIVAGDLWLLGRGDPTITGGGRFGKSLPFEPTRLGTLIRRIKKAGVSRVEGRVMGSTGYFARDWWARGWKSDFPSRYIPFPAALNFEGNVYKGGHIDDPERLAARRFKRRLEAKGIEVTGKIGTGKPPRSLTPLARVRSVRLSRLLQHMDRHSSNFFAEVLGKRLGMKASGRGSIAAGASAIEKWAAANNVGVNAYDSSGLSYSNRVSPQGVTRLLGVAERRTWGKQLLDALPHGGQGTLERRLHGIPVRAKTGTLSYISALSGWVWLERTQSWAEFSIMSSGMSKSIATDVEDRIVKILHNRAR